MDFEELRDVLTGNSLENQSTISDRTRQKREHFLIDPPTSPDGTMHVSGACESDSKNEAAVEMLNLLMKNC